MAGVNKYNIPQDQVDVLLEFDRRLKSIERSISGFATATSYTTEEMPWPSEAPNGDHASAAGVLWINPVDNSVYRWSAAGEWAPFTPAPDRGPKSFWYLDAPFNTTGAGANTDINAWVDDGETNSSEIVMALQEDVTVTRAGLYKISTALTYPVNGTGRRYVQVFDLNVGNVLLGDWRGSSATGVISAQVSRTVRLTAGQQFFVRANQDSGSTLALLAGRQFSYLQVEYAGP